MKFSFGILGANFLAIMQLVFAGFPTTRTYKVRKDKYSKPKYRYNISNETRTIGVFFSPILPIDNKISTKYLKKINSDFLLHNIDYFIKEFKFKTKDSCLNVTLSLQFHTGLHLAL